MAVETLSDPSAIDAVNKKHEAAMKLLGGEPPTATLGQSITITIKSGGKSIFWRDDVTADGEPKLELVEERQEGDMLVRVERKVGPQIGQGSFNLDFLLYSAVGIDLSGASKATLETLRLPARLLTPFLVLIILSYLTPRGDNRVLDRYFAKMNTPVLADHDDDRQVLERAYAAPETTAGRKLFPQSDWEFVKPTTKDVVGFVASCVVCVAIIVLLIWLASIGS